MILPVCGERSRISARRDSKDTPSPLLAGGQRPACPWSALRIFCGSAPRAADAGGVTCTTPKLFVQAASVDGVRRHHVPRRIHTVSPRAAS